MKLPSLAYTKSKTEAYITQMLGLNTTDGARAGEFLDDEGVSSRFFPALATRESREVYASLPADGTALYEWGKLCWITDNEFYYDGESKGTLTDGDKQIVNVNTKIVIFPDKVYYDTNAEEYGSLEISVSESCDFTADSTESTITATTAFTFGVGDAVTVTGMTSDIAVDGAVSAIIRSISDDAMTLTFDPLLWDAQTVTATIAREIPGLDYICEWNNRLWGTDGSGNLYASALGSPQNFNIFDGLSTDSYAVAVGTDGDFTGIAPYASHLVAFKEDCIHKIYGTKPSNYELATTRIQGVRDGCSRSLVNISGYLYFVSRSGVMEYSGSIPVCVSKVFGESEFADAICGTDGTNLYLSCTLDGSDTYLLFDRRHNRLWHRVDNEACAGFAYHEGTMYFLRGDEIYAEGEGTETVPWSLTFAPFDGSTLARKGFSRFRMRCEFSEGSYMVASIKGGTDGKYEEVSAVHAKTGRIYEINIIPKNCDVLQLKLEGEGDFKLLALSREFDTGGRNHG